MAWVLLVFAALTGAVLLYILWPLGQGKPPRPRSEADVAFYRAQLAEVERDTARGLIPAAEFELARTEVARRLLAASAAGEQETRQPSRGRGARMAAAVFILVVIPAVSAGLYSRLGSPSEPDQPLEARLHAAPENMDLAMAIARIEAHLATHPDDGRGFAVIAPVYLRLGRFEDAVKAYAKALELLGDSPELREQYGEALVAAAGGTVRDDARQAFERALARDPSRPKSRYYLALAAEQAGDKDRALQIFTKLADEAANAPWGPMVRHHIAILSAAPSAQAAPADQAAAIASLPPAEQQAAIRGMVDRLAERLARDGHDPDGWVRLVRAYSVLSDTEKARAALADARRSLADDHAALARLDDLARELGLGGS
jgi:cytochrome c-type biogenesis protein CcmH